MKKIDLERAFRDEDYYLSLTEAERAGLDHPAAAIEVHEDELRAVTGGVSTEACTTSGWCSPCPRRQCF